MGAADQEHLEDALASGNPAAVYAALGVTEQQLGELFRRAAKIVSTMSPADLAEAVVEFRKPPG